MAHLNLLRIRIPGSLPAHIISEMGLDPPIFILWARLSEVHLSLGLSSLLNECSEVSARAA
jgi:hypothetical protein